MSNQLIFTRWLAETLSGARQNPHPGSGTCSTSSAGKSSAGLLLGILVVLVGIQFVPVARVNPPVVAEVPAPAAVRAILRRACYDCHSHETVWPCYSQVTPFSWLVAHDVRQGREGLNFSTWNRSTTQQQVKQLKES